MEVRGQVVQSKNVRKLLVDITSSERRALLTLLNFGKTCDAGCIYEEMSKSTKQCDECEFEINKKRLIEKLELI